MFVIQKHDATRLHYDFRLAMDGVLKSWAVPKGVPLRRGDKRLAVQVEDHPMDYAHFEGVIPEGNYGGGTVMLWDVGTYEVVDAEPSAALAKGRLVLRLAGQKLNGLWSLVRMKDEKSWLLIKSESDAKPISARREDQSVLSGRTMNQIARDPERVWESHQKSKLDDPPGSIKAAISAAVRAPAAPAAPAALSASALRGLPSQKPAYVTPMKALLKSELPRGDRWTYEIKLDGIRTVAVRDGKSLRLYSRKPRDITADYPEIVEGLRGVPGTQWVLDGEIVALDKEGRSSFQLLQNVKRAGRARPPILFYAFDLLNYGGRDLQAQPLTKRKEWLTKLLESVQGPIRVCTSLAADADTVWKRICELGLEGVIAKRSASPYEPGRRSGAWVKVKSLQEQEFVIGGYTRPKGARTHLGAILVGYYENRQLRFAGKVGTGFDEATLQDLSRRFTPLRTDECPFEDLPTGRGALSRAELKLCTWVKPKLVCQVKFQEWTSDAILRQPVFLGLREDKPATSVRREMAQGER